MLEEEWSLLLDEMSDDEADSAPENTFEWMPNKCFRQLKK